MPSLVSWTSVSKLSNPSERARSNASNVFSGASYEAPRWAIRVKSLKQWGWLDQQTGNSISPGLTISSFHFEQLQRSIALRPNIAHGWLLQKIDKASLKAAIDLGLSGIYPNANKVTKKQIDDANNVGLVVRTWGIANSKPALRSAYRSGAVGTTVDWPSKARLIIESL